MNKKRVGIVVSTLLVLVMSIALLAGCGLDINFRKKVEKKNWEYSESGRTLATIGSEALIESSERSATVKKAIEKTKKVATITKTVGEKSYQITYDYNISVKSERKTKYMFNRINKKKEK